MWARLLLQASWVMIDWMSPARWTVEWWNRPRQLNELALSLAS